MSKFEINNEVEKLIADAIKSTRKRAVRASKDQTPNRNSRDNAVDNVLAALEVSAPTLRTYAEVAASRHNEHVSSHTALMREYEGVFDVPPPPANPVRPINYVGALAEMHRVGVELNERLMSTRLIRVAEMNNLSLGISGGGLLPPGDVQISHVEMTEGEYRMELLLKEQLRVFIRNLGIEVYFPDLAAARLGRIFRRQKKVLSIESIVDTHYPELHWTEGWARIKVLDNGGVYTYKVPNLHVHEWLSCVMRDLDYHFTEPWVYQLLDARQL